MWFDGDVLHEGDESMNDEERATLDRLTNEVRTRIDEIYRFTPAPTTMFVPHTNREWLNWMAEYESKPIRTDGEKMDKQVLVKDNTREEAFVTYKKVGNEIVVTKTENGDFQVNINRYDGDKGSKESIVIPREFGRLLGEALMKETWGKTGCGVGQTFFDSPEFQEAWARWVRRH